MVSPVSGTVQNLVTSKEIGSNYFVWAHGDGDKLVTASPALLVGIFCNATFTGATNVEDGATDAGTVVITLPNGFAAGTYYDLHSIKMDDGIFIDDGSSAGTMVVLWRYQ